MKTSIESQLHDFLARNILFVEEGETLPDDASFIAEGVIDSLGVTELVEYVRRQFGFEVPLRDIVPANFDSVTKLAGYIRRRLAEGTSHSPEVPVGAGLGFEPKGKPETNACAAAAGPGSRGELQMGGAGGLEYGVRRTAPSSGSELFGSAQSGDPS